MRVRNVVAVASCAITVASCTHSSKTAASPDATRTLHRAALATAHAKSFEADLGGAATVVYQAPDRYRVEEHGIATRSVGSPSEPTSTGPATIVNVYIGRTWYRSDATDTPDPTFTKEVLHPEDPGPPVLVALLEAIGRAALVQRAGATLSFHLAALPAAGPGAHAAPADGEARLRGSYVQTLTIHPAGAGANGTVITFSHVNTAPAVRTPPT